MKFGDRVRWPMSDGRWPKFSSKYHESPPSSIEQRPSIIRSFIIIPAAQTYFRGIYVLCGPNLFNFGHLKKFFLESCTAHFVNCLLLIIPVCTGAKKIGIHFRQSNG